MFAVAAQNMIDRSNGIERVNIDDQEYFIAHAALETLPWSLAIVILVDEAIAPSIESQERIIEMKNDALGNIDIFIMTVLILFIVAIALIILFISYFSKRLLAVVIADVSGKGVPAALFMVITKTLIKNNSQLSKSPKVCLQPI